MLDRVSEHINQPSLRVWFEGTRPVELSEDCLEISVPNSFAKEYIESRFKPLLEEALGSTLGREEATLIVSIRFGAPTSCAFDELLAYCLGFLTPQTNAAAGRKRSCKFRIQ